jgi:hypothetical protein
MFLTANLTNFGALKVKLMAPRQCSQKEMRRLKLTILIFGEGINHVYFKKHVS